jgi:hypothetical protein
MDQDLLDNLLALGRINLPVEVVREVLEHEKWRIREQHRHEREMLSLNSTVMERNPAPSDTDADFNAETSGGLAEVGSIAKAKVSQAASKRAEILENPDNLPIPLLSLLITISWCGKRMGRWPQAKDTKSALSLRTEFEKEVEKHGVRTTHRAVKLISSSLVNWDPRIVSEQLEELAERYEAIKSASFSSSPLFVEFSKSYPNISPDTFDKCYDQNNQEFVRSAIHLLRREFTKTPPYNLEHMSEGWNSRWQQHLPHFMKQWQEELNKMETRMRSAQRAWKKSVE